MLMRAVVVAYDADVREGLRRSLEALDLVVSEVAPAADLKSRLRQEVFDLLVAVPEDLPEPLEITIADVRGLPERPEVILMSDAEDLELRARLLAAGALAVVSGNLPPERLRRTLSTLVARQRMSHDKQVRTERELDESKLSDFASNSGAMRALLKLARKVTPSDSSLLVLGETGVGKEWLGRAIHAEGPRATGPFIAVNPAALPEQLLESELFGHEKGAFTGATRARRGAFELAHGGTLFLDEIGDLPTHLQIKLLRVLQERRIRRLGSENSLPVDVRIMAATHRDLGEAIEREEFRQDLYYRLAVVKLEVPPLRERVEDVRALAETYLDQFSVRLRRAEISGVSIEAMHALESYAWPGNVRELANVIERAVLLCEGELVTLTELPEEIAHPAAPRREASLTGLDLTPWLGRPLSEAREDLLETFESMYLSNLLKDTNGSVGETADRAGIDPRTLYNKMKRYGLSKEQFKREAG